MTLISNFLSNFISFCLIVSFFFTKLLTLGILFSTAVRAIVVATLLIIGISPLTSCLSCFTKLLSLLKSSGTGADLSINNLSALLFKLLKSSGTVFNLSTSILPTSAFKLAKSDFAANLDVSIPVAFFKSAFVA